MNNNISTTLADSFVVMDAIKRLKKCGISEIGEHEILLSIVKKPEEPKGPWYSPPFYFYMAKDVRKIEEALANGCGTDTPGSLVAWMCKHSVMHSWEMPGSRYDIGNLESYEKIQQEYKGITK